MNNLGFTTGKSTATAIYGTIEYLINSIKKSDTTTAIFLDFSKAFDCLSHIMLLEKLEHLGIKGPALKWFKSYLSE